VSIGGGVGRVLAAVFALRGGRAACLQLTDEAELRRGGVYLLERDDAAAPGIAPRFDELFADAAVKCRRPGVRGRLLELLERARVAAEGTRPRLEPAGLEAIASVVADAAALDGAGELPGPFTLEELVAAALLIFVSEEERYPRPRYRGCGVALARFRDAIGPAS